MIQPLLVANWKMNKTVVEAEEFANALNQEQRPDGRDIVVCGPFTTLATLRGVLAHDIGVGAQTMHQAEKGAFTGEISASMLLELGCSYVIIGHSERRQYFGETDTTVHEKILTALRYGLIPIVCVGELLAQRQNNETEQVVTTQVQAALAGLTAEQITELVIAYEPIWAIGTGLAATPEQAQTVHALIRKLTSPSTPILYGGSVTPDNIKSLMTQPDINGGLIGGASLDVQKFLQIVNY
ncbi:MAG: Triosephosphate isomerase [uncultured bacterium]|nr:MAG: Triosephosphate isomerase [uncultured bacterium]